MEGPLIEEVTDENIGEVLRQMEKEAKEKSAEGEGEEEGKSEDSELKKRKKEKKEERKEKRRSDAKAPTSGGPRLGKLRGLNGEQGRSCCEGAGGEAKKAKGGIKLLPLVMLFVVFGPALLPLFVYISDRLSCMDFVINTGLVEHPREHMKKFYSRWDPSKLPKIEGFVDKYRGKYCTLYKKLEGQEAKYKYLEEMNKQSKEDDEYYGSKD